MTHAPILVVDDAANARAPGQDLEQLVDLLLILGKDVSGVGLLDRVDQLIGRRVLVERYCDCAQPLRRTHCGIEVWSVFT